MNTEFEAKFLNIDKNKMRQKLTNAGAQLIKQEFLQKRVVFNLPSGHQIPGAWLRVRDEGDKITLSLKIVNGDTINDQKEIQLIIDDFDSAVEMLSLVGADKKAYQESKREIWQLNTCEIMIDEWPYIEPYIEIEGPNEDAVKEVSSILNFDYSQAVFGAADTIIAQKYNISKDQVNNHTPRITFNEPNPFIK